MEGAMWHWEKSNNAAHRIWHVCHHSYLVLVDMHSIRCSIAEFQEVVLTINRNLHEATKSLLGGPERHSRKLPGWSQSERLVATGWASTKLQVAVVSQYVLILTEVIGWQWFSWWSQIWAANYQIQPGSSKIFIQKPKRTSLTSAACCPVAAGWATWTNASVRPSSAPSQCCCSGKQKKPLPLWQV